MSSGEIIDLSNPLWEHPDFPYFYCNESSLQHLEVGFKESVEGLSGELGGDLLKVEEVYYNSMIEGIELDRYSIRSSLNQNLGGQRLKEKEEGAVALLNLAIESRAEKLTHDLLQEMNRAALVKHDEAEVREKAGQYVGDMLIIQDGRVGQKVISDKGVSADRVEEEMEKFISWYNQRDQETPITNAVRGHIHFEKIHPFADGNGRVGRALMNMSLMSDLGLSTPLALSKVLQLNRKLYYQIFQLDCLDLTATIKVMAPVLINAVEETKKIIGLTALRKKSFSCHLNERQRKVFDKVVTQKIESEFKGKLTNQKYRKLSGVTDEKMAQRDLKYLVEQGLLIQKGRLKGTYYVLGL